MKSFTQPPVMIRGSSMGNPTVGSHNGIYDFENPIPIWDFFENPNGIFWDFNNNFNENNDKNGE